MPLPSEKKKPVEDPDSHIVLLYGQAKVGKSTFVSQAKNALFLATEPGLNSLEVFQKEIKTWDDLLTTLKEVATEKHSFNPLCIDTVDNMYQFATDWTCKKFGVDYLGDVPHGKAWAVCSGEFQRVLTKMSHLPMGLFLISHSQEKEFITRTGSILKSVPTLPDRARRVVLGLVDVILYAELDEESSTDGTRIVKRVLRTSPTSRYEAGDRTGKLPDTLELNYQKYRDCFIQKPPQFNDIIPPPNKKGTK